MFFFFFFNDTATTEIYTLSLHDALPILWGTISALAFKQTSPAAGRSSLPSATIYMAGPPRSEEHTSELQSQSNLVCRLLLEKKKKKNNLNIRQYITNVSKIHDTSTLTIA